MKNILFRALFGASALAFATSANAAIIFIDFVQTGAMGSGTGGATAMNPFNTLNQAPNSPLALNFSDGSTTGASISTTFNPGASSNGGVASTSGAAAAAGFTGAVSASYHFSSGTNLVTYSFTGLDSTAMTTYAFTAYGSRAQSDSRPTRYQVDNGVTPEALTIETSQNNNSAVAAFSPLVASPTGTLSFSFNGTNTAGNQFGYLNALKIETAPVPEPTSAILLGSAGLLGLLRRRR